MTPKESPGHIYESVCLNQITPSGRQSIPSGASVLSDCVQAFMCWEEISRTASRCVSLCAALRWSHPWGVWMKTGEVPSSPRWVLSWGIITFFGTTALTETDLPPLCESVFWSVGGTTALKSQQDCFQTAFWSICLSFVSPTWRRVVKPGVRLQRCRRLEPHLCHMLASAVSLLCLQQSLLLLKIYFGDVLQWSLIPNLWAKI